jgi:hypothetical protein
MDQSTADCIPLAACQGLVLSGSRCLTAQVIPASEEQALLGRVMHTLLSLPLLPCFASGARASHMNQLLKVEAEIRQKLQWLSGSKKALQPLLQSFSAKVSGRNVMLDAEFKKIDTVLALAGTLCQFETFRAEYLVRGGLNDTAMKKVCIVAVMLLSLLSLRIYCTLWRRWRRKRELVKRQKKCSLVA